jgi:hypothetical protein
LDYRFFDIIYREAKIDLTFGCAGIKMDSAPLNLQRIPVEISTSPIDVIIKQELAYLFLLNLIGKNKIKR